MTALPGKRFDRQICSSGTRLQTMALYLFLLSDGVSQACQPRLVLSLRVFFPPFLHPRLFLRSLSRRWKRALVTPAPPISLETDEAASPPSLHSPSARSLSFPVMSQILCNFPGSPDRPWEGGGGVKGRSVFVSVPICMCRVCLCTRCKCWCQTRAHRSVA